MVLKQFLLGITTAYVGYMICDAYFDRLEPGALRGKNVLVTGASSGIGEQTAYRYARLGANVFITARREQLLQLVVKRCKSLGDKNAKFGYVTTDMAREQDTERFIRDGVQFLGGLDHLVLNHAAIVSASLWNGSQAQVSQLSTMLEVNVVSFVRLTAHALPHLRHSGGTVTVVASILGRLHLPYVREYVTTKFAMDGFFSSLRSELVKRHENVSITVCILGLIGTDSAQMVHESIDDILAANDSVLSSLTKLIAASPDGAADAIIRATTRRQPELFYPWYQMLRAAVLARQFFPTFVDHM